MGEALGAALALGPVPPERLDFKLRRNTSDQNPSDCLMLDVFVDVFLDFNLDDHLMVVHFSLDVFWVKLKRKNDANFRRTLGSPTHHFGAFLMGNGREMLQMAAGRAQMGHFFSHLKSRKAKNTKTRADCLNKKNKSRVFQGFDLRIPYSDVLSNGKIEHLWVSSWCRLSFS